MPFDDGVRFAAVRADRTQAAADATPGVMAALLGATLEQAEAAPAASAECWIANDNAPGQVVLAGTPAGLDAGVAAAKAAGARTAKPLAVGGAFHTPLMQPAADALCDDLASVPLAAPSAPVVSNDDGEPYSDARGLADAQRRGTWPSRCGGVRCRRPSVALGCRPAARGRARHDARGARQARDPRHPRARHRRSRDRRRRSRTTRERRTGRARHRRVTRHRTRDGGRAGAGRACASRSATRPTRPRRRATVDAIERRRRPARPRSRSAWRTRMPVDAAFGAIEAELGPVEVLVNNAGRHRRRARDADDATTRGSGSSPSTSPARSTRSGGPRRR